MIRYLLISFLLSTSIVISGQSLWFNKNPVKGDIKNKNLVIFTDKDISAVKNEFMNFWSENVTVRDISEWKHLKRLKNRNSDELYILVQNSVNIYEKPKLHARPKEVFKHEGVTLKVFSPTKRAELFSCVTRDRHFDRLELVSSVLLIKYITESIQQGLNKRNFHDFFEEKPGAMKDKSLLVTDHYIHLSGVERNGFFPDEIIKHLQDNVKDFSFPVITFVSIGKKEYYRTIIFDGFERKPLLTYTWTLDKS